MVIGSLTILPSHKYAAAIFYQRGEGVDGGIQQLLGKSFLCFLRMFCTGLRRSAELFYAVVKLIAKSMVVLRRRKCVVGSHMVI